MRDSAVRVNTTSFSAMCVSGGCAGAASPTARSIMRSSCVGLAVDHRFERREDLRPRDLGEEAQRAEVDPEDRHVVPAFRDRLGHRQQRAVAAQHQHEIDLRRQISRRGPPTDREPAANSFAASVDHTASTPRSRSQASSSTSVSRAAVRPGLTTMPIRIRSGSSRPQDLTSLRCIRNSLLPSAPVIGESIEPDALQSYFSGRGGHLGDDARVHVGIV